MPVLFCVLVTQMKFLLLTVSLALNVSVSYVLSYQRIYYRVHRKLHSDAVLFYCSS